MHPFFMKALSLILAVAGLLLAQSNDDCLMCHGESGLSKVRKGKTVSLFVDKRTLANSVHGRMQCTACHKDAAVKDFPHPETLAKVNCGTCHPGPQARFDSSIHGKAMQLGSPNAPTCLECHGSHAIVSKSDPSSRTYKLNIPILCGKCHKEGAPIARLYEPTAANVLENYSESMHGVGLYKSGLIVSATCSDCHGYHQVLPHSSPASTVSPINVARTCMQCHANIESVHQKVVKKELWEKAPGMVPVCSSCHPPHVVKIRNILANSSDQSCIRCHERANLHRASGDTNASLTVKRSEFLDTAHQNIPCTKCHTDVAMDRSRPCETSKRVDCAVCHKQVADFYLASGHGQARSASNTNAPACTDCHGTHIIKTSKDETSRTFRGAVPELCGTCHRKSGKANVKTHLKEVDAIFDYSHSVHGKGLKEKGLLSSAICTDCHTSHLILASTNSNSSVSPANIPRTCATCHKSIYQDYLKSDHHAAAGSTNRYPHCADCHTAHVISEIDKDQFMKEVTLQCGNCHKETAETYLQTYHGKTHRLGFYKSAKCSDCHGAHRILRVANPDSSVAPGNRVATCQKCHVNAGEKFSGYLVHGRHDAKPVLNVIFIGMTALLIGVFTFFGIHTLLWLPRSIKERRKRAHARPAGKATYFRRFTTSQRVTHLFVIVSFLSLALTGMLLKFANMGWAAFLAKLIGGVQSAGLLHRFGALVTFGYFAYHLYTLVKTKRERKIKWIDFILGPDSLMFNRRDLSDLVGTVKWFLHRGPRPSYGRWTYWEKFDYMAVFWGVAIIGFSGLVLWFPQFFTLVLPGWVINAALIVHSDEALLAVGFIFTIHFFNTHMRPEAFPMDTVIFTGLTPIEEYKADRPREVAELTKSGKLEASVVTVELSDTRMRTVRLFGFTALGIGIVLVLLIIFALLFG